ncbi:MAG: enoyl-CoA hydratase/isomerase family protein [Acidobacteria bacterium]|nr:enoyl-CoA hydratase/isomerase family protein [Acidobacteriota bacterium]
MGVLTERQGAAAVVILDWPEKRNALGPDEATAVAGAVNDAATDPSVCGIVLTGNGAFCAGGNLRGAVERSGMDPDERRRIVYGAFQGLVRALVASPVPTVAALDGPAVGMGFDLAMACDSRFVGAEGWAQQGWGKMGLVAATGGVLLLRRRAPGALWSMLETQGRMDGARLAELGLAEPVASGSARERAVARIEALAPMSRAALEAYVELDRDVLRRELDAHLAVAVGHQIGLLASPDFAARVARTLG